MPVRIALFRSESHALKQEPLDLVHRDAEGRYAGFYDRPYSPEEIAERAAGKTFLNFDDHAFNDAMRQFLAERFPEPTPWEADHAQPAEAG